MKIPSKIASGTLILVGLGWLSSILFWPSRGWSDRTVNQMPSNAQEGVPTQNFKPSQGQGSFADDNPDAGAENTDPSEQQSVPPSNPSASPTPATPASTASPNSTTSPSPTASPNPTTSPSPTASPSSTASPSPSAVPEPIRAGW